MPAEPEQGFGGVKLSKSQIEENAKIKRPMRVFLPGANGLQSHSEAASNAGCGILYVPEIKCGKTKYTDFEGKYAPLLTFHDTEMQGVTYRKAEGIPDIDNCRIQLVAAGIPEDWVDFIKKAGPNSGCLARIIPIIGLDRNMVRMQQEQMSPYSFSLDGLKSAFSIFETKFNKFTAQDKPPIVLQFSQSNLLKEFRENNDRETAPHMSHGEFNLDSILTILLNNRPPNADQLKTEYSGNARVQFFLNQTEAEFCSMIISPGDRNTLNGLRGHLLRVASDFYWANFICSFLDSDGKLTDAKAEDMGKKLDKLIEDKVATIQDSILDPLFNFLLYSLKCAFQLNALANGGSQIAGTVNENAKKRKRIIERLAKGYTANKRRRFPISKVKESLQALGANCIEEQLSVLASHVVVEKPTNKSICLVSALSIDAQSYLKTNCTYSDMEIDTLLVDINELIG